MVEMKLARPESGLLGPVTLQTITKQPLLDENAKRSIPPTPLTK